MSEEERKSLILFCVVAIADLHGVSIDEVEVSEFVQMSDEELSKEAVWLDELLDK